jgi:hypothetical protein
VPSGFAAAGLHDERRFTGSAAAFGRRHEARPVLEARL